VILQQLKPNTSGIDGGPNPYAFGVGLMISTSKRDLDADREQRRHLFSSSYSFASRWQIAKGHTLMIYHKPEVMVLGAAVDVIQKLLKAKMSQERRVPKLHGLCSAYDLDE